MTQTDSDIAKVREVLRAPEHTLSGASAAFERILAELERQRRAPEDADMRAWEHEEAREVGE